MTVRGLTVRRRIKMDPLVDYEVLFWRISSSDLPEKAGDMNGLVLDQTKNPQFAKALSAGWKLAGHTVNPIGSDILITMFLSREKRIPDTADSLINS
jgi:hypothetical protein